MSGIIPVDYASQNFFAAVCYCFMGVAAYRLLSPRTVRSAEPVG